MILSRSEELQDHVVTLMATRIREHKPIPQGLVAALIPGLARYTLSALLPVVELTQHYGKSDSMRNALGAKH